MEDEKVYRSIIKQQILDGELSQALDDLWPAIQNNKELRTECMQYILTLISHANQHCYKMISTKEYNRRMDTLQHDLLTFLDSLTEESAPQLLNQ